MGTIGKRVRDALYVHRSVIAHLDPVRAARLQAALAIAGETDWNVVRLESQAVGLLRYRDFDLAAFPELVASIRVDLGTGQTTVRNFACSDNPLILHRKEQLVGPDHVDATYWASLTAQLEARGLFRQPHLIGRKNAWNQRLVAAGVRVEGHSLCLI